MGTITMILACFFAPCSALTWMLNSLRVMFSRTEKLMLDVQDTSECEGAHYYKLFAAFLNVFKFWFRLL